MAMRRDKDQFDRLWRSRIEPDNVPDCYRPGQNLRVDKALKVLSQGQRLLDIGCGDGTFLEQAKGHFEEVFGVDIAEAAINQAIKKGVRASILNLNSDRLPYQDRFFDVVTLLSVFQYFYDPEEVLRECCRVLSDGGVLLMSVPNMRTFWRIGRLLFNGKFPRSSLDSIGYDGGTLHYFCYANLVGLLSQNGFRIEWAHGIFCIPRFLSGWTDKGLLGTIKREFFSAECFIKAVKCFLES